MSEATDPDPSEPSGERRPAPWRGRKRVENPRDKPLRIRVTASELEDMEARAERAGLSLGAFVRAAVLGSAGPRAVRRPTVDREQLALLLGKIGNLAGNVNQIAKFCNATRTPADARMLDGMKADIAAMRDELMKALGRGD